MARRYSSGFEVLGFDFDPTPGDPDVILNQIIPTYTSLGDDAQSAFDALRGNAMADGTGKTMDALRNVIGSKYPPKLQQTADSFHGAAQVYRSYAQTLSDAQSQLDRAMDQAQSVAGAAAQTVPQLPTDATAEQQSAAKSQQQNIDQANADLTAAKRLGQDAKDLRDQAGHTFNKSLNELSTVPERGFFQKFLDFFEHNPLIKILIDVAIAITTIFFPVVGLALGAAVFFGETALDTISTGHFDVGSFVAGLAGLAVGGLGVAAKFLPSVAKGLEAVNSFGKAIPGVGKLIFEKSPNLAAKGIGDLTKQVGKNFAVGFGIQFGISAGTGLAATGINDALEGKQFTGTQAAQIFAGAAAAGAIGGALKVGDGAIFKDPEPPIAAAPKTPEPETINTPEPSSTAPKPPEPTAPKPPEPEPTKPPEITVTPSEDLPPVTARPNDPDKLSPPDADQRPDALADPGAVGSSTPAIKITPPEGSAPPISSAPDEPGRLAPPGADTRPDAVADPAAVGNRPPSPVVTPPEAPAPATITPPQGDTTPLAASAGAGDSSRVTPPAGDSPAQTSTSSGGEEPPFTHEGTLGRQGFDALNGVVQNVGSQSAQVGIAVGLDNNDKDDDGDPGTALADAAQTALPSSASAAAGGPALRQIFGGPGHPKR